MAYPCSLQALVVVAVSWNVSDINVNNFLISIYIYIYVCWYCCLLIKLVESYWYVGNGSMGRLIPTGMSLFSTIHSFWVSNFDLYPFTSIYWYLLIHWCLFEVDCYSVESLFSPCDSSHVNFCSCTTVIVLCVCFYSVFLREEMKCLLSHQCHFCDLDATCDL